MTNTQLHEERVLRAIDDAWMDAITAKNAGKHALYNVLMNEYNRLNALIN